MVGWWGVVWLWLDDGAWCGCGWMMGRGVAVVGWWGVVWLWVDDGVWYGYEWTVG